MTVEPPLFFVCGTPRDRHGFECAALDGRREPEGLRERIDRDLKEQFPKSDESTHVLSRIPAGASEAAVFYAEYRRIEPNDKQHNRGAYIAAGFWAACPLTPAQAFDALDRIEAIHNDLAEKRDPGTNRFPRDFRIPEYTAPDLAENYRGQWVDLLCRTASGTGGGDLIQTSGQVGQGALADLLAKLAAAEAGPPRPSARDNRSPRLLLAGSREALDEAPRTHRNLRKLERLEKERAKIIKALAQTALDTPRRAPGAGAAPVIAKREIALLAAGAAAILAVIGAVMGVLVL